MTLHGVPNHGLWCETRTFQTRCPICDASVFQFTCSCGSWVRFDELGAPWPIHDCRALPLDQKLDVAFEAVGQKATERYIAKQMMTGTVDAQYGRRIQRAYRERVEPSRVQRRPPREILREVPYVGVTAEELGVVRELNLDVDLYAKLGMPRTSIGAAALGELRGGVYAQLTVHTGALGETDEYSYTFFVERQQLTAATVRRHQLVRVRLRGCPVLERDPVWLCDHIELATPSSDGQDEP